MLYGKLKGRERSWHGFIRSERAHYFAMQNDEKKRADLVCDSRFCKLGENIVKRIVQVQ